MDNTEQLDILYKLKKEVEKSNNYALVNTINQVIKKVYLNQFTASFVGHFSAGKSTLINLLLEQNILPSSPVPTTSNTAVVSVAEEPGIIANLPHQQYTKLKTYDDVKQMNRQNVDVESVEINFPSNKFNNGFTLQDTPGVDSNVATHQSSTEQFMYTSNILFYTVDYNHVQSALNFKFMRRINEVGIPIVFVINQIDKHNEDEISFDTFKSRVEKSIKDWDIELTDTYYVSKFEHPENQINELSNYLVYMDNQRESVEDYVNRTIDFITEAQLAYIQNEIQDILDTLDIEEEDFEQAYMKFQQNQEVSEEAQLLNDSDKLLNYLKQKRKDILDNAYIMTHDMREQLRSYLESKSEDFKVGGLFNKKKKKEEEQEQRLNQATDALQDKVNQQIRQPLREDMSFLTRFINDSEVNNQILNQDYLIKPSLISDLYQPQTSISNTYVLTFSDEVVKALNKHIEHESNPIFKDAVNHAQASELTTEDNEDKQEYEKFIELKNLRESLTTHNYQHYYIHLDDSLDKLIGRTEANFELKEENSTAYHHKHEQVNHDEAETANQVDIQNALQVVEDVPLFDRTKKDIKDTMHRLNNQITKIGVFGTFSAGKSSLINALLGGQYLVSSPNPTTAATTELSYGEESQITLKSSEQLLDEVNNVLEYYNASYDSLESFINSDLKKLKTQLEKNQLAFIDAIEKHYDMYLDMLNEGEVHTVSQEDVKKWSAEDEYATFVKTVHLNLPLEWLKGKIIVDSLGLHSNNQRHTNETEQILTSSDLILYVSYFNHSFTDNDKAFIEHMKAMNQLNENQAFKMVINAVDLAENEDDLNTVRDYVADALGQVNLHSEIFSVSSRKSLKEGDQGIDQLRDSIQRFADVESKTILEQQMVHQIQQMNDSYKEMIEEFHNNKEQIQARQEKLLNIKDQDRLNSQLINTTSQHTNNEVDEQIYHLNNRLNLQLLDEVKSVYNSQMTQNSDFNEEKKISTKTYLDQIHQRLYLEQSLITERIKKYFNSQLEEQIAPIIKKLNHIHVLVKAQFDVEPDVKETPFLKIDLNDMIAALPKQLTKRKILNPNSQRDIQEQIANVTLELLQDGLSELKQELNDYVQQMSRQAETQFKQLEQQIQEQIDELLSFKLDDTLIQQLETKSKQLDEII
ncbi:dynamin family protein [Staphylococcus capitis]|uniref:GTP-binding protein n=1 Tax=Staphylococcus capitis TaxID=29388 RepID=A0A7Z8E3U4_STACP|nr:MULTISPECIES: dynamin family protein [Staphylococcus]MBC3079414.1 dynamin family protein [Staphylococcus capitis]MBC8779794.1 dynamin family protein [Staphylococcus capitis]MBE7322897.1 dynamin family protein [Staphylococcus capitis]MBU5290931.1 dynamin family protein [Staphylococcus capitis]MCC3689888.1 dynamin family protein [Staphylococcus capitis]